MSTLDPKTMSGLAETVKKFLDEGRMFTGYDITIETRTRMGIHLRHSEVNNLIHEIEGLQDALDYGHEIAASAQENGNFGQTYIVIWKRILRMMPNGIDAWVYYPFYLDPAAYQPRVSCSIQTAPPPRLSPNAASISTVPPAAPVQTNQPGTYSVDDRNRLLIPTKFLKEAGINPGDTVSVVPDSSSNMILVMKNNFATQNLKVTTQKVERNGDIRLSSRTLKGANLTQNSFLIETNIKVERNGAQNKVVAVKVP